LIIFNTNQVGEITLQAGTPIGRKLDPNHALDKPTQEQNATVFALETIVQGFGKLEEPTPEGCPKTAGFELKEVPSNKLLETIDINPDLSIERS
jgi:hypothetical protein